MLRRRIFSSAMASVMALSSIAVVANAEETVNQVKTKADLEKLVNETYGDAYRADVLPEYGTLSAEVVLDALEAADAIIEDADATDKDYTVAYAMVEATVARLQQKTATDLKKLMDENKKAYESNNILNEELGDLIYVAEKYDAFVEAYDNAESYIDSDSLADITDAWILLNDKVNDLPKLNTVSKADFRRAIKDFESLKLLTEGYDDWRVGNVGWSAASNHDAIYGMNGNKMAFGFLKEICFDVEESVEEAYKTIDSIEAFTGKTSREDIVAAYQDAVDAVALFKAWTPDSVTKSTKAGVQNLLDKYHAQLVKEFNATSAENLALTINSLVTATKDGEVKFEKKLADESIGFDLIGNEDWAGGEWNTTTSDWGAGASWSAGTTKMIGAALTIKSNKRVYVLTDADGYWVGGENTVQVVDKTPELTPAKMAWTLISANVKYELTDLIKVTAADIAAGIAAMDKTAADATADADKSDANSQKISNAMTNSTMDFITTDIVVDASNEDDIDKDKNGVFDQGWMGDISYFDAPYTAEVPSDNDGYIIKGYTADEIHDFSTDFVRAVTIAEKYLTGNAGTSITAIDDIDAILDITGKSGKEWALVYRYLYYALTDRYEASAAGQYTKRDVQELLDDCYELMDLTGDAAIFHATHIDIEATRQETVDWLREASAYKKYKDHVIVPGTGKSSDSMYKALKNKYDALSKEYNAMKYSFGQIYDKIADVKAKIDANELDATAALVKALDDTAYALSVVNDEISLSTGGKYADNYAFTVDREFMPYNRVITTEGEEYVAGLGGKTYCKPWFNGSHYNLKVAYEALIEAIKAQDVKTAKGDVNNDTKAYQLDDALLALKIANNAAELTVDIEVIDHNGSGSPDLADALAILKEANK